MAKQTAVELIDKLSWRLRLLHYGLQFMDTENGEPNQEQIRDDLSMLVLEIRGIVEDGEDRHEGPLGPLPPGMFDGKEG